MFPTLLLLFLVFISQLILLKQKESMSYKLKTRAERPINGNTPKMYLQQFKINFKKNFTF